MLPAMLPAMLPDMNTESRYASPSTLPNTVVIAARVSGLIMSQPSVQPWGRHSSSQQEMVANEPANPPKESFSFA